MLLEVSTVMALSPPLLVLHEDSVSSPVLSVTELELDPMVVVVLTPLMLLPVVVTVAWLLAELVLESFSVSSVEPSLLELE